MCFFFSEPRNQRNGKLDQVRKRLCPKMQYTRWKSVKHGSKHLNRYLKAKILSCRPNRSIKWKKTNQAKKTRIPRNHHHKASKVNRSKHNSSYKNSRKIHPLLPDHRLKLLNPPVFPPSFLSTRPLILQLSPLFLFLSFVFVSLFTLVV